MELIRSVHKKNTSDDNMIPLINIVFLLLIFFMVAGQMQKPLTQDISLPVSTSDKIPDANIQLELTAAGQLYINDKEAGISELNQSISKHPDNSQVLLKADLRATAIMLDPVMEALRKAGIQQVQILVTEENG